MDVVGMMIVFLFIILLASVIQVSTGFGFAILATPFLLLMFDLHDAIQINLLMSIVISAVLIRNVRADIDKQMLKRFIIGSVIGLPIGLILIVNADVRIVKIVISCLIFLLTFLLLMRVKVKQTKGRDLLVGGMSGTMTSSIGMPGPPMLLYFSGIQSNKEKIRATTAAFYLLIYPLSFFAQLPVIGTSKEMWIAFFTALPVVALGFVIGQFIFNKMNLQVFRIITYGILLFTAAYLLFS